MSTAQPSPRAVQKGAVKAYIASLTGTSLEYDDFALFSVASALVFTHVFFPAEDQFIGLILSFSTFAVGYFARPIGGVVLGRLGDRIGRKNVLVATLLLIGLATVLIGVLPSYGTIGVLSAVLVVYGLMIRLKLKETPVFQAIAERAEQPKAPISEVLRGHPRALLTSAWVPLLFLMIQSGSRVQLTLGVVVGMAPLIFTGLFRWTDSGVIIAVYVAMTAVATIAGMSIGRDPAPEEEFELLADAPDGVDAPR